MALLTCAAPACWDLTSASAKGKTRTMQNKLTRNGYLQVNATSFSDSIGSAELALIRSTEINPNHVLRDLMPPKVNIGYDLRTRPLIYVLPVKVDMKFITRHLYNALFYHPST